MVVQPDIHTIYKEIEDIAALFSSLWDHLAQFRRHSDDQNSSLQKSLAELETKNEKLAKDSKWLIHQNRELKRRCESQKPDLENAIDARNAALQKLKYAYQVIRDLVNENERLQVASGLQSSSQIADEEREGKHRAMEEAMETISVSSGSSDSDRTARQNHSPVHHSPTPKVASRPTFQEGHHPRPEETRPIPGSDSTSRQVPITPEPSCTEPSSDSEHSLSSLAASIDDGGRWSIHYGDGPPGSSNMSFGPVSRKRLLRYSVISLAPDVEELERLEADGKLGLRLYIKRNVVFLNDPIFLEERATDIKNTYILDWGKESDNTRLTQYIQNLPGSKLHTFVFPDRKKKWYYVGCLNWRLANPISVWKSLEKMESRTKVLSKLAERSPDLSEETLAATLDNGELSQFCVKITSDGLWQESKDFAAGMGYQSPPSRIPDGP